jgi:hypothetical protein
MSLVSVAGELCRIPVPFTSQDIVVQTSEGTWVEFETPVPKTRRKLALNIGRGPLLELRRA